MRINHTDLAKAIPALLAADASIWLWGPHAIGKSSVFRDYAKAHGYYFMTFYMSSMGDPSELAGVALPVTLTDGAITIRYVLLEQIQKAIDWANANPDKLAIVVFDEINRVLHENILGALFSFVLDKRAGQTPLPSNFRSVALANPPTPEYLVSRARDIALEDRFAHYYLEPTAQEFLSYASKAGTHASILNFLTKSPASIAAPTADWPEYEDIVKPSARKWATTADKLVKYAEKSDDPIRVLQLTLPALVGSETALSFIESLRDLGHAPLSGEEILNDFENSKSRWQSFVDEGRTDLMLTSISSLGDAIKKAPPLSEAQMSNIRSFGRILSPELFQKIALEGTSSPDHPLLKVAIQFAKDTDHLAALKKQSESAKKQIKVAV